MISHCTVHACGGSIVSLLDQFEPIFFNVLMGYQFAVSWLKVVNIVGIGSHRVLGGRGHSIPSFHFIVPFH